MRLPSRLQPGKGPSLGVQRAKLHTAMRGADSISGQGTKVPLGSAAEKLELFETVVRQGHSRLKAWLGLHTHYQDGTLAWLLARGPRRVSCLSVRAPGFPRAIAAGKGVGEATRSLMT